MRSVRLLAAALAVLAVAACSSTVDASATTQVPAVTAAAAASIADPTIVRIPSLGVSSSLLALGLNGDGTAAVPPVTQPAQASWYEPGYRPGEVGPAVILGHVSGRPAGATRSIPGVFARLRELKPGDEVLVDRADGSTATFQVTAVELHDKTAFPTEQVFGDTATPTLRLITCGGTFDPGAHSYDSNVVVFAALVTA